MARWRRSCRRIDGQSADHDRASRLSAAQLRSRAAAELDRGRQHAGGAGRLVRYAGMVDGRRPRCAIRRSHEGHDRPVVHADSARSAASRAAEGRRDAAASAHDRRQPARSDPPARTGAVRVCAQWRASAARWRALAAGRFRISKCAVAGFVGACRRAGACDDHDSRVPALWLLPYGDGQIIFSAYGSIFTNKVLGERDNAQLLANIVRWSLRREGAGSSSTTRIRDWSRSTIPTSSSAIRACTARCGGCWACGWCSCWGRSACAASRALESGRHDRLRARDRRLHGARAAAGGRRAAAVREFFQRHSPPHSACRPTARRCGTGWPAHAVLPAADLDATAGTARKRRRAAGASICTELHNLLARIRAQLN